MAKLLLGVALISAVLAAMAVTSQGPPCKLSYAGQMMQLHHPGSVFLWLYQGNPRADGAIDIVDGPPIFADREASTGRTTVWEQWRATTPQLPIPNLRPQVLWNQAGFAKNNPAPVHRSPLLIVIPLVWGVLLPPMACLLLWIDWATVLTSRERRTLARTRRGTRCAKCLYARAGLATDAPCPECGTMPEKSFTPPQVPKSTQSPRIGPRKLNRQRDQRP